MTADTTVLRMQLEAIRGKIEAPAYAAIHQSLPRLESILGEAKERGLNCFACSVVLGNPSLPVQMRFQNFDGNSRKASISLKRAYEQNGGQPFGLDTALALMGIIESLVLNLEGMGCAYKARRRRRIRADAP